MKIHCLFDELVSVSDLKPHPKNRNKHPKDQIKRLSEILNYQGWRYPIKVSKLSGFITSGHGRLEAAKILGLDKVPVNFQDYDSESQEIADLTSDNAIALWAELDMPGILSDLSDLGPDFNLDLLGFKDFVIPGTEILPLTDPDDVPEIPVEPTAKLGDLWILGEHRLLCGDSTDILQVEKLMDGKKAELCFTSPPYSDQREYNGGKDLATEHLAKFISTAFGKSNYFAVNLGYSRKNGSVNRYWDDYIKEAEACGLQLLSWNIWDRSGLGGSIGNQTAFFPVWHEWIFIFGNEAKELNRTKPNKTAGSKSGTNRQADGSLLRGSGVTSEFGKMGTVVKCGLADGKLHPAMFPVELPEQFINAITNPFDIVYEPFGGSGSTLIACEKTKRKCFMMELDPKYVDVIVSRWEKYTGKKAELVSKLEA